MNKKSELYLEAEADLMGFLGLIEKPDYADVKQWINDHPSHYADFSPLSPAEMETILATM